MAQLGMGLGKEVWQGILIGLACIVLFVSVGSSIAQLTSHGPEQTPTQESGETAPEGDH